MIQRAGANYFLRNRRRLGNRDRTVPHAPEHNGRRHQDQQTQNQHDAKHNSTSFPLRIAHSKTVCQSSFLNSRMTHPEESAHDTILMQSQSCP